MNSNRYDTDHLTEAQFEPGSRGRVLQNLPGIRSKREMDALEVTKILSAIALANLHASAIFL